MITGRSMIAAMRVLIRGDLARYAARGVSEVERLESELQEKIGVQHALGVNSGTSALICALVGVGIGPGDEVLVPAYTWVSSAAAVLAVGAVPVLVEIDESLTIDPLDIKRKITPQTRAIIPVHMLNLVCNMEAIMAIAKEHSLVVIEDACQAVGVTYKGQRVGSIGDAGVFSFQQRKNIHAGEGGALLTNDDRICSRAVMYHDVGSYTRERRFKTDEPLFVGVNYRMPEISAAILRPQLRQLDAKLDRLRARRRFMLEQLDRRSKARLKASPHHDRASAVGLCVFFETPEEAQAFTNARGVSRLIDTGRHVYTNWESLRGKRPAHPKLDPYAWSTRSLDLTPESCPNTLKILARTCSINLLPELPTAAFRFIARRITQ